MVAATRGETGMGVHQTVVDKRSAEDRRSEDRHEGLVETAIIWFRGQPHHVPVLNISTRGTMIESALEPRLGETVLVEFPECSRIHAFVRWAREGRIGLNFGHEILLGG
jgi:hypothetical protein